jgi:type IV pilus assembly protein PilM
MKEYDLQKEEAEVKKRNLGLSRGADSVFPALVGSLAVLADELNKHLAYWNNSFVAQSKGIPVQVFLAGGSAVLPGLAPFLSSHLGISVMVANPWITSLSFKEEVPELSLSEALRFAPAIGLGLRSFV